MTRDVEVFGKQDPYVKISYLGSEQRTRIHENAGKAPVWNQTFNFQIASVADDFKFEVKDNDTFGATLIGAATIKASSFCINNGVRDWFTFEFKGRSVGQILMASKFTPAGASLAAISMPQVHI